ncbi:MAG: hypothetical protein AB7N99_08715 [Simkaniaceae bacterium]
MSTNVDVKANNPNTQAQQAAQQATGSTPGLGSTSHFEVGNAGATSAALLAVMADMLLIALLFGKQMIEQTKSQQTLGVALKNIQEDIGTDLLNSALSEGITQGLSGVMTLAGAAYTYGMQSSEVDAAQEEFNGAKSYKQAFDNVEQNATLSDQEMLSPDDQRVQKTHIDERLNAMKEKTSFVDENGKAVKIAEQGQNADNSLNDEKIISLLKQKADATGDASEYNAAKKQMTEQYDAKQEKLMQARSIYANKLSVYTTVPNALGGSVSAVGTGVSGGYKKEQADYQGQETIGNSALNMNQSVESRFQQEVQKDLDAITSIVQEMGAISESNRIAAN